MDKSVDNLGSIGGYMRKLKTGDTIILNKNYYVVVPVKQGHRKCQGFNCANCDMIGIYGVHYKCNLMIKDSSFDCKKMMTFGTQFRKVGKGGV